MWTSECTLCECPTCHTSCKSSEWGKGDWTAESLFFRYSVLCVHYVWLRIPQLERMVERMVREKQSDVREPGGFPWTIAFLLLDILVSVYWVVFLIRVLFLGQHWVAESQMSMNDLLNVVLLLYSVQSYVAYNWLDIRWL